MPVIRDEQIRIFAFLADKYGIPNLWPYVLLDRVLRHNLLVRLIRQMNHDIHMNI